MDYRNWNRNMPEEQSEDWRNRREQKMASRPHLHPDPRNLSSSASGYGSQRQPMPQQNHRMHSNGPRYNNHGDQRWNTNYNYSGYREHHSPHQQYQSDHRVDHHRGHGSFHQSGQRRMNFSSPKSQYTEKHNKPHRNYSSSSSNSNSHSKNESKVVSNHPEQQSSKAISETATVASHPKVDQAVTQSCVDAEGDLASSSSVGTSASSVSPDLKIQNENLESKESVEEEVETLEPAVNENDALQVSAHHELDAEKSEEPVTSEEVVEKDTTDSLKNVDTHYSVVVDEAVSCENPSANANVKLGGDKCSELLTGLTDENATDLINDELVNQKVELDKKSEDITVICEEGRPKDVQCTENTSEASMTLPLESLEELAIPVVEECVISETVLNVCDIPLPETAPNVCGTPIPETAPNVCNTPAPESALDVGNNVTIDNEMEDIELCLNYESDTEIVEGNSAPILTENNLESAVSYAPEIQTTEESCKLDANEDCMAQELKNVESKLANISIAQEYNASGDSEGMATPLKKERKKALIDATNILPSSTIKYAVREIRKNDESEIIVTPVRRSLRISSVTPISNKNVVQNLEELTPEVKLKMKFKPNQAIDIPEC